MKHFFRVGDKVRLYRKSPITDVNVGEEGRVTEVYKDEREGVKYIVYFFNLYLEQIIYQTHLAHVKE